MARKTSREAKIQGGQLLARGDIISVMEQGVPVSCRVLSCLAVEDGACFARLEFLEGERKGEHVETLLRAGKSSSS